MIIYREVKKDELEDIFLHGLTLGTGGDKRDANINKTDKFLNGFRSNDLIKSGVDRLVNIFCYLSQSGKVIDITSGEPREPQEISHDAKQTLIRIKSDPSRCYVGDLDLYDDIKVLLASGDIPKARGLAPIYWEKVVKLQDYDGFFRRPEVLVTYNIPVEKLSKIEG